MKTDLLAAFRRLDALLGRAVQIAPSVFGAKAPQDAYRGLYVDWDAVQRLLSQSPGAPLFPPDDHSGRLADLEEAPVLQRLADRYNLTPFDLDVLLVALAPEIDLRYRRLYAFLQDDVTRKFPTVELTLNLLCASPEERLLGRAHFAPDAPLVRHALLHLDASDDRPPGPLLARALRVDEQIVRLLLDQSGIDSRLAAFCELTVPTEALANLPLMAETRRALMALANTNYETLRLYFGGPQDVIKRQAAGALAAERGLSLLAFDAARLLAEPRDFSQKVRLILREGWLQNALIYIDDVDALAAAEHKLQRRDLVAALESSPVPVVLAGTLACPADSPLLPLELPPPDFHTRRAVWLVELERAGVSVSQETIDVLAGHYRLLAGQIARAAVLVARQTRLGSSLDPALLFRAARAQFSDALGELAQKIEPVHTWEDLVLPDDALDQLRELCARFIYRQRVMDDWGFDRKLSRGKGIAAMFAGPSGTGKTMAAEIIAGALNLDLYRIDLSQVVSKYIGETEKNLSRVFTAAAQGNAILFFDEADALFGKRTEVRDSHDRYANIEISYLLQQMETYEGISILATNLRQNIDPAFLRRLAFAVHFPFPDEDSRLLIWQGMWPQAVPLAEDADLVYLARQFRLSGGNIKNVALAAAFLAAEAGEPVRMAHLLHAVRRELEKAGKMLTEAERNGFSHESAEREAH